MIPGNVFLAIVKFFLVEHEQIKASSLPLQTLSQDTKSDNDK